MIERFLKAKHWQIFMITTGLPFLIQIIMILVAIIGNNPMFIMKVFPIIMIFFIGGFLAWFWSIGIGLQNKIPAKIKMKIGRFKIFLIIPLVYMILILGYIGFSIGGLIESGQSSSAGIIAGIVGVVLPLHLFCIFCMFYCLYFVAKTFRTAELQKELSFSDFAGEFFMIWLFPIGIWIIQPRINKMIED